MYKKNTNSLIRSLREKSGMTVQDLTKKTKIRQCTISNYELKKQIPEALNLWRLREALKCTADDIINDYLPDLLKRERLLKKATRKRRKML
jgi:transcriptional regulator with XRE-family HTH domain